MTEDTLHEHDNQPSGAQAPSGMIELHWTAEGNNSFIVRLSDIVRVNVTHRGAVRVIFSDNSSATIVESYEWLRDVLQPIRSP